MKKVRFFIIISFDDENVLIDFFSLVNRYLGKYDYFTQNIKLKYNIMESNAHGKYPVVRIFSFKKLQPYNKINTLLKNIEIIQNKLFARGFLHYNLISGCLYNDQVLVIQKKFNPIFVQINKNLCAQVQMTYNRGKPVPLSNSHSEFQETDIKNFFGDLYRIYQDETGS